jgi:hypothetical protein
MIAASVIAATGNPFMAGSLLKMGEAGNFRISFCHSFPVFFRERRDKFLRKQGEAQAILSIRRGKWRGVSVSMRAWSLTFFWKLEEKRAKSKLEEAGAIDTARGNSYVRITFAHS